MIYLLVCYCMPTLLKLKPSSLIHADKRKFADRVSFLNVLGEQLEPFGCSYAILYEDSSRLFLFIYHSKKLEETISSKEIIQFLEAWGYHLEGNAVGNVIGKLKQEFGLYLDSHGAFPHEVGVILGYPVNDVKDFIKNNGADYILCGYWKVYHDVEGAVEIFNKYRQVRDNSIRLILDGKKLKDLIDILH